jgi:transcriptional regulator with XRE-family HTH domain
MEIPRRVGLNIKSARNAKGWSQEELADRAGLHRTYISGLERNIRNPTITVLKRLADALGMTTSSLLDGV